MAFWKKGKKAGRRPRKVAQKGRRRLQPVASSAVAGVIGAGLIRRGYRKYTQSRLKAKQAARRKAVANAKVRLQTSDNITTAPAFKVGSPRKPSFEEKVSKISHPPVIFKRQYSWSAEGDSGRKSMFQIPINNLTSGVTGGNLYDDVMTSSSARLSTNTATADPTIIFNNDHRTQQSYYIDYMSGKLSMMNSSTNSLTGVIRLVGYKRDCDGTFTNTTVPCTPINMMAFAQSANANVNYGTGQEATVGNGYMFNDTTQSSNYTANYNMPGSSINTSGVTLNVAPELDLFSSQIKDFTGYYFKEINSFRFSLKPGQQFNISTIFNDLPLIKRQGIDMVYLRGVAHFLVVEFIGQVVGDSTAVTGDNRISTGSTQLSCIYEEKRIVGFHGKLRSQIYMGTAPLGIIAKASQFTINPDSGVADTGQEEDA